MNASILSKMEWFTNPAVMILYKTEVLRNTRIERNDEWKNKHFYPFFSCLSIFFYGEVVVWGDKNTRLRLIFWKM